MLLTNVRLFDGVDLLGSRSLLVRDGLVADVDAPSDVPGEAVIDGGGATLLPGLIDAHTHLWEERAPRQTAVFGVTTALDMFTPPQLAKSWCGPTDVRRSSYPATAPGGHCTEYGFEVPTLTDPRQALSFVDARLDEGADHIKVICETSRGRQYSLAPEVITAVVDAAHRRGVPAVAHATTAADATDAVTAGVDALMHVPVDDARGLMAGTGRVLVPTLAALRAAFPPARRPDVLDDPDLASLLDFDSTQLLSQTWRLPQHLSYAHAVVNVRAAAESGWTILAGTDTGNPGTAPGVSMHDELALLVDAGLTPLVALRAATASAADAFGLTDRGRIAAGMRADLLLVDGDPTLDIRCTRRIRDVWIGGVQVARDRVEYPALPKFRPGRVLAPGRDVDAVVAEPTGFRRHRAGVSAPVDADLTDATTLTITGRAERPITVSVTLTAGSLPASVEIELAPTDRRHGLDLGVFTGIDLSRVRSLDLMVTSPGRCRFHLTDVRFD